MNLIASLGSLLTPCPLAYLIPNRFRALKSRCSKSLASAVGPMDTPLRLTEEIPRGAAPTRESGEEDAAANRSSVHVHKQTNASEEIIKLPFMIALLSKRSLICSQTRARCAIARSYESLFRWRHFASVMI